MFIKERSGGIVITETHFYLFFFFVLGITLGSFYNVVGLRIPKKESIVFPGSHCTNCHTQLKWYELIPVFSWIFLLGKCKACKSKVSFIYPAFELLTGVLFAYTYFCFGLTATTGYIIILISMLVIISISDIDTRLIPNKILGTFAVLLIPFSFFVGGVSTRDQLIGLVLAFIINLLIVVCSKGKGMGGGDIKLFLLLAFLLGWVNFLTLFLLSVIIGLVFGIIVRIKTKNNEIAFGPSIAIATTITIFYGKELIKWYVKFYS